MMTVNWNICTTYLKIRNAFFFGAIHHALRLVRKKDDTQTKADSSNYSAQVKKQDEVSEIYSKLKEKHEGKFKPEQLNTWAHMLHFFF